MKAIPCAIIEDEPRAMEAMKSIVGSYPDRLSLIGTASSYEEALIMIRQKRPKLIFLDIQLKKRQSFDILKESFDHEFEVVFVTAFDQYAIEAFRNKALSYLLKPVDFKEFEEVLDRAMKILRPSDSVDVRPNTTSKISIPQESQTLYLNPSEVIFAKASGSYCELVTLNKGQTTVSKPLRFIEDQPAAQNLLRVHRSYLINPTMINSWEHSQKEIIMEDRTSIPVSREGKKKLLEHLNNSI